MDDKIKLLIVDDGRVSHYRNMAREISQFLPGADIQIIEADQLENRPTNMKRGIGRALALAGIHAAMTASARAVTNEPDKPNNPYYRQFEKKGRKK